MHRPTHEPDIRPLTANLDDETVVGIKYSPQYYTLVRLMHRSTRERFVGLEAPPEEVGHQRALRELETIRNLAVQDVEMAINRMLFLAHHRRLTMALDETWSDVQDGRVSVESIQVLRALRMTHIPDLFYAISEPEMKHSRVVRETRLIANLILNVVQPKVISTQLMPSTK